ncbi:MAG: type II toxin-antitoxin system RelE/ParE family toxin [Bacteroidetes bacterium]|nr:MAG: type II toxin-antitoxin system RelE/ParE family toxin [Bacteroidota bacterium]
MAEYKLTNKAVVDLNEIWEYTADEWSEEQADKYYEMLLNRCQYIADNPDLGKNYDGITTDLFGLKASRHIIFYRKINALPIEIIRILYGRMDLKNRLDES